MESIFVTTPNKTYPILFEQSFELLADSIEKQNIAGRKMCIIADENTHRLYAEEVKKQLEKVSESVYCYCFPAGEKYKNLETIYRFYEFFQQNRFDRKTIVVALGGGVCGDMAGFAAATYLRGIPFIQIPTTLLPQVDSSVGGKTGVDFNGAKNSIGAFYQPELVYINTATLKTLPKREFSAGMANKQYIGFMEHDVLTKMVRQCCLFKADVVSKDEKESGLREILNFGHTIGHALETIFHFQMLHGECVALGMLAVLKLARKQGNITQDNLEQIQELLRHFDLPLSVSNISKQKVYQQMFLDKKVNQNKIRFVLPKRIGEVYTTSKLSEHDILEAIEFVVK